MKARILSIWFMESGIRQASVIQTLIPDTKQHAVLIQREVEKTSLVKLFGTQLTQFYVSLTREALTQS